MARLLILGRSGQLARALAEAAATTGFMVTCAGRAEADLAQRGSAARLISEMRPSIVLNAAAFTAVDQAEDKRFEAFAVNADGAFEAAMAARRIGARYILISTDYVFGAGAATGPFQEAAPPAPVNAYGESKLKGEQATLCADPGAAVVRTSALFSGRGADFPSAMWRLASRSETVRVVSDQLTRPTHASDLARRVLALASVEDASGVYHAAGAPDASWADLAEAALAVSRSAGGPDARVERISTSEFARPAPRPTDSRLSGDRLERATGLAPADWREGLKTAFEIWRNSQRA